eukprot:m.191246 g.191246  ORF g.191246 m.191246 type:complete len:210 (+) comp17565_c1_seq55:1134-1763(+)
MPRSTSATISTTWSALYFVDDEQHQPQLARRADSNHLSVIDCLTHTPGHSKLDGQRPPLSHDSAFQDGSWVPLSSVLHTAPSQSTAAATSPQPQCVSICQPAASISAARSSTAGRPSSSAITASSTTAAATTRITITTTTTAAARTTTPTATTTTTTTSTSTTTATTTTTTTITTITTAAATTIKPRTTITTTTTTATRSARAARANAA